MSASLSGSRPLPDSKYDLSTYWGRVRHSADIADMRTLFVSKETLEASKVLLTRYKLGEIPNMTPELWKAKKIVDSTLHPDTGEPVLLPFRMSSFVLSNLVVTAGMLQPNLGTRGTLFWQITNQSLNVAINTSNANKSHPLSTQKLLTSYALAVSASCSVALGLNAIVPRLKRVSPATKIVLGRLVPFAAVVSAGVANVFLMRSEEILHGIDVYSVPPAPPPSTVVEGKEGKEEKKLLGRSKRAALLAVSETAASRVINASPIMVLPPLILLRLQKQAWLARNPRLTVPVNLALILGTSLVALPIALGVFPAKQQVPVGWVEEEFAGKAGDGGLVEFNRGL